MVEKISERLREEISSQGISLAEAARIAGEAGPQRIKDIVSGKQRCPSDLLARLAGTVDVAYILTGVRSGPGIAALTVTEPEKECGGKETLSRRAAALLDNYEHLSEEDKRSLERITFSLAKQALRSKAA
jgi:hypothetical protein